MNKYFSITDVGAGHLDLCFSIFNNNTPLIGENVMMCLCTTYPSRLGTIMVLNQYKQFWGEDYE